MPHDNGRDIFNVMPGPCDLRCQLVLGLVVDAREDVVERRAPNVRVVLAPARLEEDQSFRRMLDQDRDDDAFASSHARVRVAGCRGPAGAHEPAFVRFEVAWGT